MPNRTFNKLDAYGFKNPSRVMTEKQPNIVLWELGKAEREVVVL